jgi:SPP1 gp7 family putative phage head morphogenesis protein
MAARPSINDLFRSLLSDGKDAYRKAVAAQIRGSGGAAEWDRWAQDTAAILLASWSIGAGQSLIEAGIGVKKTIPKPITFDRDVPDFLLRFEAGPAREVIARFMTAIPLTREKWDRLVDYAFAAANEMRRDEAATALGKIVETSPELARVIFPALARPVEGRAAAGLPAEVRKRRSPGVQQLAQSAFFVTGMSQKQVEATRDLLAKVIEGKVTKSVAGKRLLKLGVGDFIEQTILATGTDLTDARLETVYRTNINRAQTQGQLDIVRDASVKAFVPVMQFTSTKDNRTRDTHKAMDGYVATVEQIDSQGIPTPGGFNCRCRWKPIPLAIAVSKGWTDEDGVPDYAAIKKHNGQRQRLIDSGQFPDPGFISG